MRRLGPAGLLLVLAGGVAVLVGSIVDGQLLRARGVGTTGAILASGPESVPAVNDSLGVMTEHEVAEMAAEMAQPPAAAAAPSGGPTSAPAAAAATARPTSPTVFTRVPKPTLTGPRRIGIQAGHWQTDKAPPELWRLLTQTGASWQGINEVTINLDIAERVKKLLEPKGYVVDILPTTIPPGYLADAFVALHGDGDGTGANSGFKMAFSTRRTPYESALLDSIKSHYGAATGLAYDPFRITRNMTSYFAFGWQRNKYSTAPHTPSVILEMGYVSNDADRELMMKRPDVVAAGIAVGIIHFLDAHPREKLFGQDLLVQLPAPRGTPTPRP